MAPRTQLLGLINASWTTQAISVAVRLRLPDLLIHEPQTVQTLAQSTSCNAQSLLRLLRALTSIDVVSQHDDGRFELTELGALLRSDTPDSLAAWAEFSGTRSWAAWSQLAECVRSGQSVRRQSTGADGFEHLEVDPDAALLFNRAMVSLTNSVAAALVREGDFSGVKCLADVGGGLGQLLSSVLLAYPTMRGILFDMAHATQTAGAQLAAAGVATRCEVVTGSFFDAIPEGADAYLLKSILHDWNDEDCAQILVNCSKAMLPHARLMIIERMMPEQLSVCPHDQGVARSDLNMLVGNGGCERTQEQYRVMLQKVGLRMGEPQALCDNYQVIEAVLVPRPRNIDT